MANPSRSYRLVVFDWDGTLADSEARIVTTAERAIAELGLPARAPGRIRDIIGLGWEDALGRLYPRSSHDERRAFVECYRRHFLDSALAPVSLFEGVRDALAALIEAGYLVAIATGKGRAGLDRELEQVGLHDVVHASRCADETTPKPAPHMLLELMEEFGCEPGHTLMVGDTTYDLEMARAARTHAVAVTSGVHDRRRLLALAPVAVLASVAHVPGWLTRDAGAPAPVP